MLGVSGLALVRYSLVSVRREPHPQPHLRFRLQRYCFSLNYANFFCFFYINHPVAHHILCPQAKKLQRNRFAALEGKKYPRKG